MEETPATRIPSTLTNYPQSTDAGSSGLVDQVQRYSCQLKDALLTNQNHHPQQHPSSSSTSTQARTGTSSDLPISRITLSRKDKLVMKGKLAQSMNDLIAVYRTLLDASAHDNLVKSDLDNIGSHFRRTIVEAKGQDKRQEMHGASSRRIIEHGIGKKKSIVHKELSGTPAHGTTPTPSPSSPSSSSPRNHLQEQNTSSTIEKNKRLKLASHDGHDEPRKIPAQDPSLPHIRQVVKTCHPDYQAHTNQNDEESSSDDDDDDDELKVYDE